MATSQNTNYLKSDRILVCSKHSEKKKLFEILEAEKIDMKLTENYSMMPAASVSGIYFANENAKYQVTPHLYVAPQPENIL